MLTEDQRWLLWTVGLNISRALVSDDGLAHFMGSMIGYYGTALDGVPEWMDSYLTQSGRIISPYRSTLAAPKVTVTKADIRRFRKTIPAELLAELKQIDQAQTAEAQRTWLWCRCGGKLHQDFMGRDHYHPTDAEDQEHLDIACDLIDRERDCLRRILGIDDEPVGQLELFGVGA